MQIKRGKHPKKESLKKPLNKGIDGKIFKKFKVKRNFTFGRNQKKEKAVLQRRKSISFSQKKRNFRHCREMRKKYYRYFQFYFPQVF